MLSFSFLLFAHKRPHLHVVTSTGYQQVCVHIYKQQEEMFACCDVLENCEAFSSNNSQQRGTKLRAGSMSMRTILQHTLTTL